MAKTKLQKLLLDYIELVKKENALKEEMKALQKEISALAGHGVTFDPEIGVKIVNVDVVAQEVDMMLLTERYPGIVAEHMSQAFEQVFSVSRCLQDTGSSLVRGADFLKGRYLILSLNGRIYCHKKVGEEIWEGFSKAESLGKFYQAYLKGNLNW